MSTHIGLNYKYAIHDALRAWKRSAIPFIVDVSLARGVALQGYRALILCTYLWDDENHHISKDRHVQLVASSTTTAIIAALMIINWAWRNGSKNSITSRRHEPDRREIGTEIFIRFTCDQVLPNVPDLKVFPGRELGLRPGTSVRFTDDLDIQIATKGVGGEVAWGPVPYLHPTYKVFGSQWGKFFRNRCQALLFKGNYKESKFKKRPIVFAIPSRALDGLEKIRGEYALQQVNLAEKDIPTRSQTMFATLATATGEPYPDFMSPETKHKTSMKAVPLFLNQPAGIGQAVSYLLTVPK
uniref:Putative mating-type 1-1-2 protein n=1 Tax=Thielaviopsis cerberus TaxID=1580841 RepID=A0A891XJ45_9PEZI|nr:putative mating-type 1-1-2 protein [Thielaviopsis cerberus]